MRLKHTLTTIVFSAFLAIILWPAGVRAEEQLIFEKNNTRSFPAQTLIIDSGNKGGTLTLQFGSSLGKQLSYDSTNGRFNFNGNVRIQGNLTATGSLSVKGNMSGATLRIDGNSDIWGSLGASGALKVGGTSTLNGATTITGNTKVRGSLSGSTLNVDGNSSLNGILTASGTIATKGHLTLNSGNAAQDAILTFGNNTTSQTIKYLNSSQRFQFSKDLSVIGTLSGSILQADSQLRSSGSLIVNGATTLKSTATVTGNLTTKGTLSGAALTTMGGNSYILGNLGVGKSAAANTKLEIAGTASGRILHAQDELHSSGSLIVKAPRPSRVA